MAYFIFLKYLRSLEEFRKILVSKFLLNRLVQISRALVYSKIQFLSEKIFSSTFGPIGPGASRPIWSFWPRPAKQAEPAHQARPPFLPPSPSRRHRHLLLSRCRAMGAALPLSHAMERPQWTPLLNSVACIYSVVNPPSSLCVTGAFMAGH
jgi:hypothetical protein